MAGRFINNIYSAYKHIYTTDHLHSASCLSVGAELVQVAKVKAPPEQLSIIIAGDTTRCACCIYI